MLSIFFSRYGHKKGFGCFNPLLYPSELTFLGIFETVGFIKASWALRCTWILWVAWRRPTFSGSRNGGTYQAWSIVATRTTVWLYLGFDAVLTTPLVISQGNLESVKECLMMRVPSTPRCSPIGSWAGSVRLGYVVGWWKTLFLPNTSTPLQGTSNGWRMTWSGFWRVRKLTWRLAIRKERLSDRREGPHILLFYTFMILMFLFLNSIKDWNVPNLPRKQSYYPLIWAMREFPFIIFAYCHYSFIFFFFLAM